jgi:hypothetical protein
LHVFCKPRNKTYRGNRSTKLLQLVYLERRYASQAQMGQTQEPVQEECNRLDANLFTIGKMNPLQCGMPFDQGIDRFIGNVNDLGVNFCSHHKRLVHTLTNPIRLTFCKFSEISKTLKSVRRGQPEYQHLGTMAMKYLHATSIYLNRVQLRATFVTPTSVILLVSLDIPMRKRDSLPSRMTQMKMMQRPP